MATQVGGNHRFTVREFIMAYLYGNPSSREELVKAFLKLKHEGYIVLGGLKSLERNLREFEAAGVIKVEDGGRLIVPSDAVSSEARRLLEYKSKILQKLIHDNSTENR